MGTERVVLCGGVGPAGIAGVTAETLVLDLWGLKGERNVTLDIEDIHGRLARDVPPAFHDMVEIAAYVYAADQTTRRGGIDVDTFGGNWRRAFEFHVPVRVPDLWNTAEVKRALCGTLGFLSDDHYEFTFYPATGAPEFQMYLRGLGTAAAAGRPEQVILFSGGLDSLAGAVKEIVAEKRRVMLVNHRPTEKHNGRHHALEKLLLEKAVGVRPEHLAVRVNKDKRLGKEHTQRTRSFLFASLGATVARMLELRSVRFYENGVVSINLPICEQLVGARATRTTHPRVLRGFQTLASLVAGESFTVENPFRWETKGEIIQRIMREGCSAMITPSVSCAHTWEASLEFPHCGLCSQCLDRRFGIVAAGAEEFDLRENYKMDVFTGSRPKDVDKILGAGYLERANEILKIRDVGGFMAAYPEVAGVLRYLDRDAASGAAMVLDLYTRHAKEVRGAMEEMVRRHARDIFARTLPEDCLVRTAVDTNAVVVMPAGPVNGQKPGNGSAVPEVLAQVVEKMDRVERGLEAVARGDYERYKEMEDMKGLLAGGLLDFVRRVDVEDCRGFIYILAYGDRAKAARELGEDQRRFYERVDAWETRGPDYRQMYRLVKCRKTAMSKGTVPLSGALQWGGRQDEAENPETLEAALEEMRAGTLDQRSYPALLQEVLSALGDMDADNWQAIRGELVTNIEEEVAQ